MKTGTIVDAAIIASASEDDDDAHWVKHKGRPAVHGFKAHVGADADTALVEEVAVTPANINDGRAGPDALPDTPGEVFADSAYHGSHFREAVRARGGTPRIAATGMWGADEQETLAKLPPSTPPSTGCAAGSRKSSALEVKLRAQPHAMDRHRQSQSPGPPHRHRLQPQTNRHPHHPARLSDEPAYPRPARKNRTPEPTYLFAIKQKKQTRTQVS